MENKPLAQALYKSVEVGDSIPAKLYQAVAEILALVFRAQAEVRRSEAERRSRNASGEKTEGVSGSSDSEPRGDAMMERLTAMLRKSGEWIAPIAAVSMVFVMLVPLPSFVLDLLLTISITASILVLLTAIQILRPVQFSVFPSLLAPAHAASAVA